ncbi:hypothetical protein [Symbiopectobacterium purcellii]|uniref:hypothetical protein n=1 Tax=Symbiopectobacterium purcellii TaxID=2871826 RepID=UPI003F827B2F
MPTGSIGSAIDHKPPSADKRVNSQVPSAEMRKPTPAARVKVVVASVIAKRHYFDNSQLCFFAAYQGIGCNHF